MEPLICCGVLTSTLDVSVKELESVSIVHVCVVCRKRYVSHYKYVKLEQVDFAKGDGESEL